MTEPRQLSQPPALLLCLELITRQLLLLFVQLIDLDLQSSIWGVLSWPNGFSLDIHQGDTVVRVHGIHCGL